MKNFDTERQARERKTEDERTCVLGGATLIVRDRPRPDALVPLDNLKDPTFDFTTCTCGHRLNFHANGPCTVEGCECKKMDPKMTEPGSPLVDQLAALDVAIEAFLDPGSRPVYRELRSREDDPLNIEDMQNLLRWATEATTARPTGLPADSSAGQQQSGTPSTASSSSPVTQAA